MQKRDFETDQKMLSRFRDPTKIFRDPRFSRYHSPPLGLDPRPSISKINM